MRSKPSSKPGLKGTYFSGEILDPLDVRTRIEELKLLKPGWLDGKGFVPAHDGLDWLAEAINLYMPIDLPKPYLYPTAEAGVRAEWSIGPHELSLEINLDSRIGNWHSLNLDDETEQFRILNLNDAQEWAWLVSEVRQLLTVAV